MQPGSAGQSSEQGVATANTVAVHIPHQLREMFGASAVEHVEAHTVAQAFAALNVRYPGFGARVMEPDGRPRELVHIFKNASLLTRGAAVGTQLQPGDAIWVVPSVAGG